MGRYILQRLISTIPVLIVVSIVTLTLIRVLPGDVAVTRLGENANPENVAKLREIMGLDRPIVVQYFDWGGDLLRGEPGRSLNSDLPVGDQLLKRLPITIELTIFSLILSIIIGIPLGVISATKRNTPLDHSVRVLAVLGQAIPNFWLAILLLLFLSIQFQWVPPFTYRSIFEAPIYNLKQFILPVIVSGYALSAITMRLTRSSLLEVLGQDYIRTAKAKGLTNLQIMNRHALRNALIPIITIVGTQLGALIGGSIIVEQIFSLPGVGRLTLQAIADRDYTQLQFNVLFLASVVVFTNLLVDLSYGFIDPRIRFSRS